MSVFRKGKYDVVGYWNKRWNPNSASRKATERCQEFVKERIVAGGKILDFGVGVGRLFPAYEKAGEVVGYDISVAYARRVLRESKKHGFDFTLVIKPEVGVLPFADKSFDVVVCTSVLLHQPPELVEFIMRELARVGVEVIVVTFFDESVLFSVGEGSHDHHCFNHDYFGLCEVNDWFMKDVFVVDRNLFFVYGM